MRNTRITLPAIGLIAAAGLVLSGCAAADSSDGGTDGAGAGDETF